ncbi:MAG TPA: hypothetical protein VKB65_12410 [Myxococcota bacterium]|nr:hypothetical protein [Myxococcota bacterium]
MFIPMDQAAWPAAGEVRDLRFSLNAPVLLGSGPAPQPTRAALGWLPVGSGAVVRLWLRADGAPEAVRGFDLPESPLGPAARAAALERAERFLAGLGFLFAEGAPAEAPGMDLTTLRTSDPDPAPVTLRTSDPDPAPVIGAAARAAGVATAVRADVRLTKFRRRGLPAAAAGPPGPAGGIER